MRQRNLKIITELTTVTVHRGSTGVLVFVKAAVIVKQNTVEIGIGRQVLVNLADHSAGLRVKRRQPWLAIRIRLSTIRRLFDNLPGRVEFFTAERQQRQPCENPHI